MQQKAPHRWAAHAGQTDVLPCIPDRFPDDAGHISGHLVHRQIEQGNFEIVQRGEVAVFGVTGVIGSLRIGEHVDGDVLEAEVHFEEYKMRPNSES